jgi:hypothetical protein
MNVWEREAESFKLYQIMKFIRVVHHGLIEAIHNVCVFFVAGSMNCQNSTVGVHVCCAVLLFISLFGKC